MSNSRSFSSNKNSHYYLPSKMEKRQKEQEEKIRAAKQERDLKASNPSAQVERKEKWPTTEKIAAAQQKGEQKRRAERSQQTSGFDTTNLLKALNIKGKPICTLSENPPTISLSYNVEDKPETKQLDNLQKELSKKGVNCILSLDDAVERRSFIFSSKEARTKALETAKDIQPLIESPKLR